ncbi:MAG: cellulase family glycosylhydrolase, partial [Nitrosopumilus sp.]|nr:cellulase family glycosylhydrolase [Nitrosopumilus sp.]
SYGSTPDYECNDLSTCNSQFQYEFAKIDAMGFNTIRVGLAVTYRSEVPVTSNSRHFTVFYDENMGPGNQWDTENHAYDLDITSNFTDINSTNHFNIIKNILTEAQAAGLKVILICGQGFKDTLPPYKSIIWQTYDSQAASDFAIYLRRLASEITSYPALLAYDFINEPIYQDMYRNASGTSNTKQIICEYVKQWTDAIHQYDLNHLVTIGSGILDEMLYFDPGIMKLDFYSAHIYTKGHPMANYDIQNGFDRYDISNYWMSQTYPMPWIIGETGFAADDNGVNPGLYPNHLDNNPIHHNPPWMFGSEQQQELFAQHSLDITRNAGGSGYAWWAFQNVFWYDLNSNVNNYQEDFFGLLHFGDKTINTWYDKPAVSVFQNYLINGQPPMSSFSQPPLYYDPYNIAANCITCISQSVQGKIVDEKGNDIKNAVVFGTSWIETEVLDPQDPSLNRYEHDISYTFTHPNGTFEVYPYNYFQPGITNPHRIVSIEISAVGAEKKRFGSTIWPYGDQAMVSNINTQTLRKITNGYNAVASNETVTVDEERNYYGRYSLTVSNLFLIGKSNLTARNEIHINSEYHAHVSIGAINNEIHIYTSDAFPDCPIDFNDYLRISGISESNEQSVNKDSKNIEINFKIIKELKADIFPNPSDGKFNIIIQNPLQNPVKIEVSNTIGQIIWQTKTNTNNYSANFDNLPKGLYLIYFSNDEQTITKKLVIN